MAAPPELINAGWQPGQLLHAVHLATWSAAEVQARSAAAFGAYPTPIIENDVDLWLVEFVTTGPAGDLVSVPAQLFVPVELPVGPAPILVYGSGTTGIGPACAPSREYLLPVPLGYYRELLAPYAGRGFATIMPDYIGYDLPNATQLYFHAQSEAHVLLDASRAVTHFYDQHSRTGELEGGTFFAGYSQGGHAAFAVADRQDYAPEVHVGGAIGFAATTNVRDLLGQAAFYAPYVALAYQAAYGVEAIRLEEIFGGVWLDLIQATAGTVCVDRAQQLYPYDGAALYLPEFYQALLTGSASTATGFLDALDENSTGLTGHGLPALLIQGGNDIIVTDRTQERFVTELCRAGSPVRYLNYQAARHRDTRAAGFEAATLWMRALTRQDTVPNDCP